MSFTDNNEGNRLGRIAGFSGILAIIFNFVPILTYLSLILAPFALIAGLVALRHQPRSMAIVGIVTGLLYFAVAAVVVWASMSAMQRAEEHAEIHGRLG